MKRRHLLRNEDGATLVEFAVTAPFFFLLMFGMIQAAMMLWVQVGLQHGVEAAARCASVSDIAVVQGGVDPSVTATPCYTAKGNAVASANAAALRSFAAANSFGLKPPTSTFTVARLTATCPAGNEITASYDFTAMTYLYAITLKASSCYPTIAS